MHNKNSCRLPILIGIIARGMLCLSLMITAGCSSEDQIKPLKPLRIATGNWEPFVGENLPHNGPLAEMVSTILVNLGYVPEFKFYDWPMVEIHLETGYPSLAFPYIQSDERTQKGFRFSEPLHTFDYVLFYHKDRYEAIQSITSLSDLEAKGFKIGRIRGYAKLKEIQNDKSYIEVPSAVAGFQMLRKGNESTRKGDKKIDFLLESRIVGLASLEGGSINEDKDHFMYLGQNGKDHLISKESLKMMLSPKLDAAILGSINREIKTNKEFFDNLRARIGMQNQDRAWLVAPVGENIYGYAEKMSGDGGFLIPRNSRVLVTEWGSAFTTNTGQDNGAAAKDGRSEVKLLSGPSKGKVVWVGNRFITLER